MSPGEWKGTNVTNKHGVLILGESHYGHSDLCSYNEQKPSYNTYEVVEEYLDHRLKSLGSARWDRFFDNIAGSFGYSKMECKDFYDKVWFGNYVPVLCGIGKYNKAKYFMKEHRDEYNDELFKFINENKIETVICFSIATYWNLPSSCDKDESEEILIPSTDGKRNIIYKYKYAAMIERNGCSIVLDEPLLVYGVRHPSARSGFIPQDVYNYFKNEKSLSKVLKHEHDE